MTDRPMSLLRKVIAGSLACKTRLHDESGQIISLDRLLRNGGKAASSWLMVKLFDKRAPLPWISHDAQAVIERFLSREKTVLEFGSGMSTAWYARHAGQVVAIESDPAWFASVSKQLAGLGNVELRRFEDRDRYISPQPERSYDLIVVDGLWRDDCAEFAISHLARGGIVYLDNSDRGENPVDGNIARGRALMIDHAKKHSLPIRRFTDFVPGHLGATQGLMIGGPAV